MGLPQICLCSPTGPAAQPGLAWCWPRGGRAGGGSLGITGDTSPGLRVSRNRHRALDPGFCFSPLLLTEELLLPSFGEGHRSASRTEQTFSVAAFKTEGQSLEEREHVRGGFGWNLNNRCHSRGWFYYPRSVSPH